jgi:ABC-type branched-subunit amino acid transport system ATPase component
VLETRDLTIRFGGHVAVDHVSCRFEPGTLTSIVGPNGAGKTTYFNLISGQLPASEGRVTLAGARRHNALLADYGVELVRGWCCKRKRAP